MTLSVIIVNYNVRYFVEQCLHAVFASIKEKMEVEIFVVDNASDDESVSYLQQRFPKDDFPYLHILANTSNVGFGRANNQAAAKAKGKYLLFLNPDTLLTEETLSDCLSFAEKHPDMGGLGVKMLQDNGVFALESRRGLPTPWNSFCKMSGLAGLFPHSRLFGEYYMRYLSEKNVQSIKVVSGAFMMVRRDAMQTWFDEDFFMYGEDIDLSCRLLKNGKKNYYLPTKILHYKGESTRNNSYRYLHVFYEGTLLYGRKYHRRFTFWFLGPVRIAIFCRALLSILNRRINNLRHRIFSDKKSVANRYLYFGRHSDAIQQLAAIHNLSVRCIDADEQSLPDGHLSPDISSKPFRFVIYDTASYSRRRILDLLSRNAGHHYLGTFSPQTGVLITREKTFVP